MADSREEEDERLWRLDAILADTMHEAVVKLAALNNRFFVLSVCFSDIPPQDQVPKWNVR